MTTALYLKVEPMAEMNVRGRWISMMDSSCWMEGIELDSTRVLWKIYEEIHTELESPADHLDKSARNTKHVLTKQ